MKIKPIDDPKWKEANGDYTYRINYDDLNNNSVVVDLGARHGDWAKLIKYKYNSLIYCFEPVKQFHDDLINKGFKSFCYAVSNKTGIVNLGIFESEASLYYNTSIFTAECIPASSIFELIGHNKIDLMKINVEGAEYEILENLIETNCIKNIVNLQIQFHLFEGSEDSLKEDYLYSKISTLLEKTHSITWRFPFAWENWKLN